MPEDEIKQIYDTEYKKACEFSEKYQVGLSANNWHTARPAERERFFIIQCADELMDKSANAATNKAVEMILEEIEQETRLTDEHWGYGVFIRIEHFEAIKKLVED